MPHAHPTLNPTGPAARSQELPTVLAFLQRVASLRRGVATQQGSILQWQGAFLKRVFTHPLHTPTGRPPRLLLTCAPGFRAWWVNFGEGGGAQREECSASDGAGMNGPHPTTSWPTLQCHEPLKLRRAISLEEALVAQQRMGRGTRSSLGAVGASTGGEPESIRGRKLHRSVSSHLPECTSDLCKVMNNGHIPAGKGWKEPGDEQWSRGEEELAGGQ
jgi:hypothetical protein